MNLYISLIAFLLGSIPSGYIYTKLLGKKDIRQMGSGNVGAMNTTKESGLIPGALTLLTDILKGSLAVYFAYAYGDTSYMPLLATVLVIIGHNFNPFLSFKGGKGLACLAGALLLLEPIVLLYLPALAIIFILILRDTNTATGFTILSIPVFLNLTGEQDYFQLLISFLITTTIFIKHHIDFEAYRNGRRKLF